MFKKILVPLDGSELAERSLELASALIKDEDAEIFLLSVPVLPGYQMMTDEQASGWDEQAAAAYLKEIEARQVRPKLVVQTQIWVVLSKPILTMTSLMQNLKKLKTTRSNRD